MTRRVEIKKIPGPKANPLAVPIFYPDGTVFIPLSKSKWSRIYSKIDFEDFEIASPFNWNAFWSCKTKSYYAITGRGKSHRRMHRLITGTSGNLAVDVDHRNHDTRNNCRKNLRITTRRGNTQNRRDNKSGYPGVHWDKSRRKWLSNIKVNGKTIFLGRFFVKSEAASSYKRACEQIEGEGHA